MCNRAEDTRIVRLAKTAQVRQCTMLNVLCTRSPATHSMSPWVRRVFLSILPRLLIMPRPYPEGEAGTAAAEKAKKFAVRSCNGIEMRQPLDGHERDDLTSRPPMGYAPPCYQPHPRYTSSHEASPEARLLRGRSEDMVTPGMDRQSLSSGTLRRRAGAPVYYSREVLDAIDSVNFIAEHLKKEDQDSSVRRMAASFGIA